MYNKLHIIIESFLIGMLFEYLLRVEVSFFPVFLLCILTGNIILDLIIEHRKMKLNKLVVDIKKLGKNETTKISKVPKGWMVYEAGQDALHMLWYVHLVNFDDVANNLEDIRQVYVEEGDTYGQTLNIAINQIKFARYNKN